MVSLGYFKIESIECNKVRNRELLVSLVFNYVNKINLTTIDPDFILRYAVYMLTADTIVINNQQTRNLMKNSKFDKKTKNIILSMLRDVDTKKLAKSYKQKYRLWKIIERKVKPERLSNKWINIKKKFKYIHKNFKEIKTVDSTWKKLVKENEFDKAVSFLNKQSKNYILQNFTHLYKIFEEKNKSDILLQMFEDSIMDLQYKDVRYIIKLINTIRDRITGKDFSKITRMPVFVIRNGKVFIKQDEDGIDRYFNINNSIKKFETVLINKLYQLVAATNFDFEKKTVYLHESIKNYKISFSDKSKFNLELPAPFSFVDLKGLVETKENYLTFGIHWFNMETTRVDLDLSAILFIADNNDFTNCYKEGVSWNTRFNINDNLIFTGDVTNAPKPKGATELILVNPSFIDKQQKINKKILVICDVRDFTRYGVQDAHFVITHLTKKFIEKTVKKNSKSVFIDVKRSLVNFPFKFDKQTNNFSIAFDIINNHLIFLPAVNTYKNVAISKDRLNTLAYEICDLSIKPYIYFSIYELLQIYSNTKKINLELFRDINKIKPEEDDIVISFNNFNNLEFENMFLNF